MSRLSLFLRHRINPLEAAARHVPPLHQAGCTTMLKWFLHHTGLLGAAIDTRSAGARLEVHMQSQYQPFRDDYVDRVITLESLAVGLADIEDLHGLPRTDVHRLIASAHDNPPHDGYRWPRDAAHFPATRNRLRDLGTPSAQTLLDEHTVKAVRLADDADYAAFGHLYVEPSRASERRTE